MLWGRRIELDIELDATAGRHHDRVGASLRLRSTHVVGERHAVETHNFDRNAPLDAGAVDVNKVNADIRVRRGIDETPKLFSAGNNADVGHAAGRIAGVADRDPVDAQKRFLFRWGGALNLRGRVDALAERALRQSRREAGIRGGEGRRDRRSRTMDIAERINRCRLRCGCGLRLWNGVIAHDQDSVGNRMLASYIVVRVLDHDCAGQSEQGLGFALAVKMRVIPIESRRMIIRHGNLIGALARSGRLRPSVGHEICGDHIVARRNTWTARHRLYLQPMKMQIGVAGGLVVGAGHDVEISRHAGDAREVGVVAGRSRFSQNRRVVDAIEQAHAEDFAGPYPNRRRNAGSIAVTTIDEAKPVAILTGFELDRLNPALHAGHFRRIF